MKKRLYVIFVLNRFIFENRPPSARNCHHLNDCHPTFHQTYYLPTNAYLRPWKTAWLHPKNAQEPMMTKIALTQMKNAYWYSAEYAQRYY